MSLSNEFVESVNSNTCLFLQFFVVSTRLYDSSKAVYIDRSFVRYFLNAPKVVILLGGLTNMSLIAICAERFLSGGVKLVRDSRCLGLPGRRVQGRKRYVAGITIKAKLRVNTRL